MDVSQEKVDEILSKYDYNEDSLILMLMDSQELSHEKFVSEKTARYIARKINVPDNQIYEVLSFFSALNDKPKGKYHIQLCDSTVCRVNKKDIIEECLEEILNIQVGETTSDNLFTLDHTPCFGACDISPAIRINKKVYGNLTISKVKKILNDLKGETNE